MRQFSPNGRVISLGVISIALAFRIVGLGYETLYYGAIVIPVVSFLHFKAVTSQFAKNNPPILTWIAHTCFVGVFALFCDVLDGGGLCFTGLDALSNITLDGRHKIGADLSKQFFSILTLTLIASWTVLNFVDLRVRRPPS